MTSIAKSLMSAYHTALEDWCDPRTKDWFLVSSPWTCLALLVAYHQFVYKIGPEYMKNRKPFNLDRIIQIYNIGQVLVCGYIVIESLRECYGPTGKCSWACEPMDFSDSPHAVKLARLAWTYYMVKVVDLLDTVFFVLRKKNSQISFLHVYHHIGMVILGWVGSKYVPGGQGFFLVPINCFVHCFMYAYYFLTNYKPEIKAQLWWKKYLTQLQMFQFLCIMFQLGRVLFQPECTYPRWPIYFFLPHNFIIFYLFWDFYKKTYIYPQKAGKSKAKAS